MMENGRGEQEKGFAVTGAGGLNESFRLCSNLRPVFVPAKRPSNLKGSLDGKENCPGICIIFRGADRVGNTLRPPSTQDAGQRGGNEDPEFETGAGP